MDATHEPEEWRPIPGYEGSYEVSDRGKVRSARGAQRILKPWMQKGGYPTVQLRRNGQSKKSGVHSLVLEAFIGPRPAGMDGCHNDGDPLNNTPSNLRWGSRSDNMHDAVAHGTHNHARKTHCIHGHEFTAENTRVYTFPNGVTARFCRACKREYNRQSRRAS